LGVAAGVSCTPFAGAPSPARNDRAALRYVIDSMLAAPDTRHARWGVLIVDPERGDTLYSHDAGKLFVPASNQKIVTSAVVLETLGPEYRYSTPFLIRGTRRDSVIEGDLLVEGRGDPSISDHMAGDAMLPLRAVADSIFARGVRVIRGRVEANGDAFPDAHAGFGWGWDDLDETYGATVDELLFNEGFADIRVRGGLNPGDSVKVRVSPARTFPRVRVEATTVVRGVGRDSLSRIEAVKDTLRGDVVVRGTIPAGDSAAVSVTFRNPNEAYVAALTEALRDRGIAILDSTFAPASTAETLFVAQSPPMSQILAAFMKPSQNQLGEMLFKTIGLTQADTGSARVARRVVTEKLRGWGAQADGFIVWDGSGLSRRDMVSPETVVRVLDVMRLSANYQTYYDAMTIAGIDGTLRTRMRGTTGEANVRGKTGTLGNVRSLSGYVTTAGGATLIFSVLCNNYLVSTDYISRVQDSVAVRLSRLPLRSPR
jgi:D-alanyl-D-alanine carboxypeptidase/D-alanyl-D-alanine-endopeptidase (penicillin-binding protein 4)